MRAPSQEIVNATLLEIFLLFSFLLLLVIAALQVDLTKTRTALRDAANRAAQAEKDAEAAKIQLQQANLVYKSNLVPDCPSQLAAGQKCGPRTCFMRVVINGRDDLAVTINRDESGFKAGDQFTSSRTAFRTRFDALTRFTRSQNCKLRAFIQDTGATSKEDYKLAKSAVVSQFYLSEN